MFNYICDASYIRITTLPHHLLLLHLLLQKHKLVVGLSWILLLLAAYLMSRILTAWHWKGLVRFVARDQLFRVTEDHLFAFEVVARLVLLHRRRKSFWVGFLMIYWFRLILFCGSSKLGCTLLVVGILKSISDLLINRSHHMLLIVITLKIISMVVFILGPRPQILILVITRQRMVVLSLVRPILHLP